MIRYMFLIALVVSLSVASQARAQQKKLPTVAEVLGKLKEKRDSGGVQVYNLQFEKIGFDNGRTVGTCREEDEFQIDWGTGKFRWVRWAGCDSPPFEIIKIFDGEKTKTQFRFVTKERKLIGQGEWKFGIGTGRMNSGTYPREYWPVFFQKGAIACLDDRYYPGHFVFDPDPQKFFVDGEVTKDGQKCISLKTFPENPVTPMQYEYIIAPKKDYSVVGYTYYQKNIPFFSLLVDVGEAKQPGQWMARAWTLTMHGANGKPKQLVKVKVASFAENVPIGENNKFDIVPPEGAKVGRSHYELPEGTQDQKIDFYEYKVKDGKLVQVSGPAPPLWDRVRNNLHWFALTACFAAATFIGFRARRGWKRGPPSPPAAASE